MRSVWKPGVTEHCQQDMVKIARPGLSELGDGILEMQLGIELCFSEFHQLSVRAN